MTAPTQETQQDLVNLLTLVDVSRARAVAAEQRYLADIVVLYTERAAQAESEEESSPLLNAALLAGAVILIRKAFQSGVSEGVQFASSQLQVAGLPPEALGAIDLVTSEYADELVADFLSGQVDASRVAGVARSALLADLKRRAMLAVVSAVQAGRGVATEMVLAATDTLIDTAVHKMWVARFDLTTPPCGLCVRLHGQHVPVNAAFSVPSTEPVPYRKTLQTPPRHPNCRCSLVILLPEQFDFKNADVTPLSMQAYASWALTATEDDRNEYLAATIVHVKPYTRMVDGKIQYVDGYYYDIESGQKIPESQAKSLKVKTVSAKQAKSMTVKAKTASSSTPQGGGSDLKWKPGTYKIDNPEVDSDTQVIIYKDGSSSSIFNDTEEESSPALTAQFMAFWDGKGAVTKISDSSSDPDPDGPGPQLEPNEEAKTGATLAPGYYLTPDTHYGGILVNADGSGKLFNSDFSKGLPLKAPAIAQVAKGHLGAVDPAEEEDFLPEWQKSYNASQAGGAKPAPKAAAAPNADAVAEDISSPGTSGDSKGPSSDAPADLDAAPDSPAAPSSGAGPQSSAPEVVAAPEGGPGDVLSGPTLFSVGPDHTLQFEEGSQVFRSGKSKDTLYVLQPDGDLIKYNPQGAGVQATKVGSSENPVARAQLLAGLNNVSEDGVSIKNQVALPGTGKVTLAGVDLTSSQISSAIAALIGSDSQSVGPTLKNAGNPLAGSDFQAIAAPHKAYYNNKTKPALLHALNLAQAQAGSTPLSQAAAVSHLESSHGLADHQSSLGHSDNQAIHDALHAAEPKSEHSHSAAPGFISVAGVLVSPSDVAEAIDALKSEPSTSVKKPLKATGSAFANADLQSMVDGSDLTGAFKGATGKVHYGKLKPAVIKVLSAALADHEKSSPPLAAVLAPPPKTYYFEGVTGSAADLKQVKDYLASLDLDIELSGNSKTVNNLFPVDTMYDNPFAFGVSWTEVLKYVTEGGVGNLPPVSSYNQALDSAINSILKFVPQSELNLPPSTPVPPAPVVNAPSVNAPSVSTPSADVPPADALGPSAPAVDSPAAPAAPSAPLSPSISFSSPGQSENVVSGTLEQLKQFRSVAIQEQFGTDLSSKLPGNPFAKVAASDLTLALTNDSGPFSQAEFADILQKSIDTKILELSFSSSDSPAASNVKAVIEGKSFTKAQLLDAVALIKAEPSTSVKKPLKAAGSPVASLDLKSLADASDVTAKYKGATGVVHYGKLKNAVVDLLQSEADSLDDVEISDSPNAPVVTVAGSPIGTSVGLAELIEKAKSSPTVSLGDNPEASTFQKSIVSGFNFNLQNGDRSTSMSGIDQDVPYYIFSPDGKVLFSNYPDSDKSLSAQEISELIGTSFDEPAPSALDLDVAETEGFGQSEKGVYVTDNLTLKVFSDNTGELTVTFSNEKTAIADASAYLNFGNWTKVSDDTTDVKPSVMGVDVGHYALGSNSSVSSFDVFPDGTVVISSPEGFSTVDLSLMDSYIKSSGVGTSAPSSPVPSFVLNSPKDENGFLIGEYDLGLASYIQVTADGPDDVSPGYLASSLATGNAIYIGKSDSSSSDAPDLDTDDPDAPDLDVSDSDVPDIDIPDSEPVSGSPPMSQAMEDLLDKAKYATINPPPGTLALALKKAVQLDTTYFLWGGTVTDFKPNNKGFYQVTPSGGVTYFNSSGVATNEWTEEQVVSWVDQDFPGISSSPPPAPLPSTATATSPAGEYEGYKVGKYIDEYGLTFILGPNGPVNSPDSWEEMADLIDSGELSYVGPGNPGDSTTFTINDPSTYASSSGTSSSSVSAPDSAPSSSSSVSTSGSVTPSSLAPDAAPVSFPSIPVPAGPAPDAVVLTPFISGGGFSISNLDKPELAKGIEKWVKESGFEGSAGLHLSTQKKEVLQAWLEHWSKGEWDKAYALEASKVKKHKGLLTHPGSPENPANAGGFTKKVMAPAVPGEIPAGTKPPGVFPVNSPSYYYSSYSNGGWDEDVLNDYLLATNMQSPTGLNISYKNNWVFNHFNNLKIQTDLMSVWAKKNVDNGNIYSQPILPSVQKYAPGEKIPFGPEFPEIDVSKVSASNLTNNDLDKYLNHLGPKNVVELMSKQKPEVKQKIVALHAASAAPDGVPTFKPSAEAKSQLTDLLQKMEEALGSWNTDEKVTAFLPDLLTVKDHTYTLDKNQPSLNGHSEMYHVTDELGQQWLFKVAQKDFRADIEHATHELARLSGIPVADSRLGKFNGKYGQFQVKIPSQSTLQGISPSSLPPGALKEVMRSHVFDWATSNDDPAGRNFLLTPDGKHVRQIDLGRAFAAFGKPGAMKLKRGQLSQLETLYYDSVYSAMVSGSLSPETTDDIYKDMMKQARRMQAVSDSKYSEVLAEGLKRRTNFGSTSAVDADDLISQALSRKNSLVEDFESFWDDLYSEMGRDKPAPATGISANVFAGNSQSWHDRASEIGANGAATFFAGTVLEDGHLLAQVVVKHDPKFWESVEEYQGAKVGYWEYKNVRYTLNANGEISGGKITDTKPTLSILKEGTQAFYHGPLELPNVESDAPKELWISGQLREESDAKLRDWLMSNTTNVVSSFNSNTPEQKNSAMVEKLGLNKAYETILNAAKTISHHHKTGDKNYNTQRMEALAALKADLKSRSDKIAAGDWSSFNYLNEADRPEYKNMVDFYTGEIDKVEELKINGSISTSGQFVSYDFKLAPEPEIEVDTSSSPGITVELRPSSFEMGRLNNQGQLLVENRDWNAIGQQGKMFVATLPDGTQIEYRSWNGNEGIPRAQQGAIKIRVRNYDGSAQSAQPALDALTSMGVDLTDSDSQDMELLYWRHLYGVLDDRADRNSPEFSELQSTVQADINNGKEGSSFLSKDEELELWREAWGKYGGKSKVADWVDNQKYLPRFSHPNPAKPEVRGGQPYWMRFDLDLKELRNKKMPVRSSGKDTTMLESVKSGGLYSTEDRSKILGWWAGGMSSQTDQGHGSSNFTFLRLNLSGSSYQFYYNTDVLARTTNYAFSDDEFGEMNLKKVEAYFDIDKATKWTATNNETLIKHALSILDDTELIGFKTSAAREEAIAWLHSHGIFSIRGLPVTDRMVLTADIDAAIAKVNAHRKTWDPDTEEEL